MVPESVESKPKFILPATVAEPAEVMRAARELDEIDDYLRQASIRNNVNASRMPKITRSLSELAEANKLNLLQAADRAKLAGLLAAIQKAAPVLHISFATDPSAAFVNNIISRLRQSIHPYLLVQIGLQPSIAGGCVVRSENKFFDFSLRQYLLKHRDILTRVIAEVDGKSEPASGVGLMTSTDSRMQNPTAVNPPSEQKQPVDTPVSDKLAEPLPAASGVPSEAKV
jgi:F0F1-type ATP synthase delta subunit